MTTFMFLAVGEYCPVPFCHHAIRVAKPESPFCPNELKTLGDRLRKCRIDRKLFQRQVAEILGVHPLTVVNWERNATTPPAPHREAIIAFLGLPTDPDFRLTAEQYEKLKHPRNRKR